MEKSVRGDVRIAEDRQRWEETWMEEKTGKKRKGLARTDPWTFFWNEGRLESETGTPHFLFLAKSPQGQVSGDEKRESQGWNCWNLSDFTAHFFSQKKHEWVTFMCWKQWQNASSGMLYSSCSPQTTSAWENLKRTNTEEPKNSLLKANHPRLMFSSSTNLGVSSLFLPKTVSGEFGNLTLDYCPECPLTLPRQWPLLQEVMWSWRCPVGIAVVLYRDDQNSSHRSADDVIQPPSPKCQFSHYPDLWRPPRDNFQRSVVVGFRSWEEERLVAFKWLWQPE